MHERTASPIRQATPGPMGRAEEPEVLALRAQDGSVEAFSALVSIFEQRLYNFLLRRVPTPADAEDLTQEAFIRAWQRIHLYRPQWRFSTWLFTIATRLAVTQGRSARPRSLPLKDHAAHAEEPAVFVHGEPRSRVWQVVEESLTPDQQTAVWLRYVEDMAITDIATVMSRSQVSVRVMLFRARAVLAQRLTGPSAADLEIPVLARAAARGAV